MRIRGVEAGFYERLEPLFTGPISVHETTADNHRGDGIRYISADGRGWSPLDSRPYDAVGNRIAERYERISSRGREGLKTGAAELAQARPTLSPSERWLRAS